MKKIAIVLVTYDGIVNNYCGVGTSCQNFINSFSGVREYFRNKQIDLSLHLVTPALLKDSLGYSSVLKKESEQIAIKFGGRLHFIINGSNGMIPYGQLENWKIASVAAASKSLEIAGEYDETIVFCLDTPFAHTPYYIDLQKEAYGVKITSVLVFESDVLIHERENPSIDRLAWEASALKQSVYSPSIYIADVGLFITNHLIKNYGLPFFKFIPLGLGLNPESERYKYFSEAQVATFLQGYQIPLEKKIIFSVARAVDYKGFDLLIEAVARIHHDAHLVFIASPYKTEDSCVAKLKNLVAQTGISCTPIYTCDFELPRYICQWKNTILVAQLARYEPFGLVPEEVRIWAKNQGPVVLTSNCDGFVEQIDDGKDGFLVDISNIESIAQKIDDILDKTRDELDAIRLNGYRRFCKDYDYRNSLLKSLKRLIQPDHSNSNDQSINNYIKV